MPHYYRTRRGWCRGHRRRWDRRRLRPSAWTPSATWSTAPTATPVSHPEAIRQVVAEAVLADEVGLDFFGVGEHHRPDFAISAPDVVLAAIAGQTSADPARYVGDGAQLRRPDPGLPALRDPRRGLGRPRRGDPRAAARSPSRSRSSGCRSTTTRCCSPRSSSSSPRLLEEEPVSWEGIDPPAARRRPGLPPHRARAGRLGRRRRHARVGGPRGVVRPAAGGRRHRRLAGAVRAARRPLPPGAGALRPRRPCRSRCTAPATSPRPTSWLASRCTPTRRPRSPGSAASAAGGPYTPDQFEAGAGPTGALFVGSPETVAAEDRLGDPHPRALALPAQVRRRHAAARAADGVDPALRHRGRPAGARAAGSRWLRCEGR